MTKASDLLTIRVLFDNWYKHKVERSKYDCEIRDLYEKLYAAKRRVEAHAIREIDAHEALVNYAPDYEKILTSANRQEY